MNRQKMTYRLLRGLARARILRRRVAATLGVLPCLRLELIGRGLGVVRALRTQCSSFRAAWEQLRREACRSQAEQPSAEPDFLPSALSIVEVPASPAGRFLAWGIMGFALTGLVWAFAGKIEVVAVAPGKVIPVGYSKAIQTLDTAVVHVIHVDNGQRVRQGDALVDLDSVEQSADLQNARTQHDLAALEMAQNESLAKMAQDVSMTTKKTFSPPEGIVAALVESRRNVVENEIQAYRSRRQAMNAEVDSAVAEHAQATIEVARLTQALPLLRQRVQVKEELLALGYESRMAQIERRQNLLESEHALEAAKKRVITAAARLQALQHQRRQAQQEYVRDKLMLREEAFRRWSEFSELVKKLEYQRNLKRLTAPVDGVVQQLSVHTVGGVVDKAETLMVIAPDSRRTGVEVEATVLNRDIGFVASGQYAVVKLDAFPFTRYGTVDGSVSSIAKDAVRDEKLGSVYPVRIRLEQTELVAEGRHYPLELGMSAQVEIQTDKRRIVDYLLSPLRSYSQSALRER